LSHGAAGESVGAISAMEHRNIKDKAGKVKVQASVARCLRTPPVTRL